MESFEVWRDAEQTAKAWGPIEYSYPHVKGRMSKGAKVGVILCDKEGKLKYGLMQLGLKEKPDDRSVWNRVSEEYLLTGSKFESLFKTRRCLIPADAWIFSHTSISGRKVKQFKTKDSGFCFAGLYTSFPGPNESRINTVTLIEISSLDFYKEYDARMPAIFLPGPEGIQFANPKTSVTKAWELVRNFPVEAITSGYE